MTFGRCRSGARSAAPFPPGESPDSYAGAASDRRVPPAVAAGPRRDLLRAVLTCRAGTLVPRAAVKSGWDGGIGNDDARLPSRALRPGVVAVGQPRAGASGPADRS